MNYKPYQKRDLKICAIFAAIFIIVSGYQYFLYYLPIWGEKVPTHWGNSSMANEYMFASNWFLLMLSINFAFCFVPISIGYLLSKFFAMKTRNIEYSPFTLSFPFALMFFFFYSAINESVYASYLAKGVLSNTAIGVFYWIAAFVFFVITLVVSLMASFPEDFK